MVCVLLLVIIGIVMFVGVCVMSVVVVLCVVMLLRKLCVLKCLFFSVMNRLFGLIVWLLVDMWLNVMFVLLWMVVLGIRWVVLLRLSIVIWCFFCCVWCVL